MSVKHLEPPISEQIWDRREFLAASGSGVLAAALPATSSFLGAASHLSPESAARVPQVSSGNKRKIPIGVFNADVYKNLSIDAMLDKVSALGLEAMEIGTGGYPGSWQCPLDELVADPAKAKAWSQEI